MSTLEAVVASEIEKVEQILSTLGPTKEDAKRVLENHGIRDKLNHREFRTRTCPIARYIRRHGVEVAVSQESVRIMREGDASSWVPTPPHLAQLITDFDCNYYLLTE